MKLEQNKSGVPKFGTLDATITYEGAQKEDVHKRVEQVNNEMSCAMGVSKAILNNVIFCHQEDSNWPLDEGKKLKEKFDAIFGTTEYNKGIAKIIKIRKIHQDEQKLCIQEKKFLEETKKDADHKNLILQNLKEKHALMENEVENLNAQLVPLDEQMQKLLEKHQKIGALQGKQTILKTT
jgi:DNA repair protein RAD50